MIPKPLVNIDISVPLAIADACAILNVNGVKKADVNAPPVTPPESNANPTKSFGVHTIIRSDIAYKGTRK